MGSNKDFRVHSLAIIVIGASGDLAKKKTFPSLYHLYLQGQLPNDLVIYGYARTNLTHETFREKISMNLIDGSSEEKKEFLSRCYYRSGMDYEDVLALQAMRSHLESLYDNISTIQKSKSGMQHYLFYMAIPPNIFEVATKAIVKTFQDIAHQSPNKIRILYEKPFGKDLSSYLHLSQSLFQMGLKEEQIYRIDHYLGKQMVRAIPSLRFGSTKNGTSIHPTQYNKICQSLKSNWDCTHIQYVMIEMCEPFGAEGRGYFDDYGIIRDVIQNHLIQIMTLIAMEKPDSWNASQNNVRDAKCALLKQVKYPSIRDCVLGQYEGYNVRGEKSRTPTYAAIRLFVDNDRWRDVPFFLIAGKALETRRVDVTIGFRNIDYPRELGVDNRRHDATLLLRVQPEQTVKFSCHTEEKGYQGTFVHSYSNMINSYYSNINSDYSTLILDAIKGNTSSFVSDDELRLSWEIFSPLLDESNNASIFQYKCGSCGPKEVNNLLALHIPKEPTELLSKL